MAIPRGEPESAVADDAPVPARSFECDACGKRCEGIPAGSGLFVWTRGEEVRYEEPPLCEECASGISMRWLGQYADEEEEG
jgi:hypothetical protein